MALLSHQGWLALGGWGTVVKPKQALRKALEQQALAAGESPDGRRICVVGADGTLELWDPSADRRLYRGRQSGLTPGSPARALSLPRSPPGRSARACHRARSPRP